MADDNVTETLKICTVLIAMSLLKVPPSPSTPTVALPPSTVSMKDSFEAEEIDPKEVILMADNKRSRIYPVNVSLHVFSAKAVVSEREEEVNRHRMARRRGCQSWDGGGVSAVYRLSLISS